MKSRLMLLSTSDIEATASAWIARRDAGMTPAEIAEFTRWAAEPRHAAVLAEHERTWKIFDRPVNAGQGQALADEFRARFARQRRQRRRSAALAVISCLLITGTVWRSTSREKASIAPVGNAVVVVPEKRVLPDGTIVELKSGAEIAIDYSGEFRRVHLRKGEAHYQVTENAARPFIVDAAGVEVRAVGTAFSVELGRQAVAILVTEGRVAVETAEKKWRAKKMAGDVPTPPSGVVDAGYRLVVEHAVQAVSQPVAIPVSAPDVAELLSWRAPRLEFTGAALAEAVALMNRYNRVQFVIDDPSLANLEVSGYFRADNYETFLSLIEQGIGLKSERVGDNILLRKAP